MGLSFMEAVRVFLRQEITDYNKNNPRTRETFLNSILLSKEVKSSYRQDLPSSGLGKSWLAGLDNLRDLILNTLS